MKQNERILVYLVTGFLAVILVVAVMFGRDANPADAKAKLTTTQGLADILGQDAKDDAAAAKATDPAAKNASGLAAPDQLVGQQPLVAQRIDIAASQVEQQLGQSRRDRTVRFVRARAGDSPDTLVRRWCGARDPFLDEFKSLNEDLVALRLGQEVAVPWVDDEAVLAAWQLRQPQKTASVVGASEAGGAVGGGVPVAADPAANTPGANTPGANTPGANTPVNTSARPTFALPGEGALAVGTNPGTVTRPANSTPYTVKPGDSLWKVAERLYGKKQADRKIAEIRQLNPGLSDSIRPGQTFFVPAVETAPTTTTATPTGA